MAKKRRRADHPPAPRRPTVQHRRVERSEPDAELQPLVQMLKRALYADHPLALLELVSGLLATTIPGRGPLGGTDAQSSLDNLVESFEEVDLAPTTAALHVLAKYVTDEPMVARIRRTLRTRKQPMPSWLRDLSATEIRGVHESFEELDDGRNAMLDVRLADGSAFTVVIYIDHNMGVIVKDAFTIDRPFAEVGPRFSELEPDLVVASLEPSLARTRIEAAIRKGARLHPVETETWPAVRPLVEWLSRRLPEADELPERTRMPEPERTALVDAFLRSPYGAPYAGSDAHRRLLTSVVWFGTGHGTWDPLRWSPVNVEVLLADWAPRKFVAELGELELLPDLLRAFIRYAHAERGITRPNTRTTLAAVDRWEPEYRRLLRAHGPQAAEALARLLRGEDRVDVDAALLQDLRDQVGGEEALSRLDDRPLPDEPFDRQGVPEDILPTVLEVVALCDASAAELFDVEYRTANRRLVRLLCDASPALFRGRASPQTSAAAVAWMVARANEPLGRPYEYVTVAELLDHFGVTSVSGRARKFREVLGLTDRLPVEGPVPLGRAELLVGEVRADIIVERDAREPG